jgi:hypothetical protein
LYLCISDFYVSVTELKTWYESLRTRFGKLSAAAKSGDGATKELTDRDKWVMASFSFLGRYIARVPSRQIGNVSHDIHFFSINLQMNLYMPAVVKV